MNHNTVATKLDNIETVQPQRSNELASSIVKTADAQERQLEQSLTKVMHSTAHILDSIELNSQRLMRRLDTSDSRSPLTPVRGSSFTIALQDLSENGAHFLLTLLAIAKTFIR